MECGIDAGRVAQITIHCTTAFLAYPNRFRSPLRPTIRSLPLYILDRFDFFLSIIYKVTAIDLYHIKKHATKTTNSFQPKPELSNSIQTTTNRWLTRSYGPTLWPNNRSNRWPTQNNRPTGDRCSVINSQRPIRLANRFTTVLSTVIEPDRSKTADLQQSTNKNPLWQLPQPIYGGNWHNNGLPQETGWQRQKQSYQKIRPTPRNRWPTQIGAVCSCPKTFWGNLFEILGYCKAISLYSSWPGSRKFLEQEVNSRSSLCWLPGVEKSQPLSQPLSRALSQVVGGKKEVPTRKPISQPSPQPSCGGKEKRWKRESQSLSEHLY